MEFENLFWYKIYIREFLAGTFKMDNVLACQIIQKNHDFLEVCFRDREKAKSAGEFIYQLEYNK